MDLTVPVTCCVPLNRLLNLSELLSPYILNSNCADLSALLWGHRNYHRGMLI